MSLDRYLKGDDDALNDAIEECMPLVDEVVGQYTAKNGFTHLADDFVSAGYLFVVEFLPKLRDTANVESPHEYIKRSIWNRVLQEMVVNETNLGMSRRVVRRQLDRDASVPTISSGLEDHEASHDPTALIDLRMTIQDCCQSDDERLIVDMKERGFTDREIAKELGMSRERVQHSLKAIYERLQRQLNDDDDDQKASGVCRRPDAGNQVLQPPRVRRSGDEAPSLGV